MAGSIRICLIAEGFTEDLITCVDSITGNTKTPISIYANGKSNWISPDQFDSKQISLTQEKNPLGWGNVINYFLNTFSEDYLLIMDTSTTFTADPIPQTLQSLEVCNLNMMCSTYIFVDDLLKNIFDTLKSKWLQDFSCIHLC